jgi:predicted PurR-regulated permease PerM
MKKVHSLPTFEQWFFLFAGGIILYLFWSLIEPFAVVLLTAGIAAVILAPVDRFILKFVKIQKLTSVILSFAVFALLFVPILVVLLIMAKQASEIIQLLASTDWSQTSEIFNNKYFLMLPEVVKDQLASYDLNLIGRSIAEWAFENVGALFASTTKLILNTFIFFLALYYLLVDRNKIYKLALKLSPLRDSVDSTIAKRIVKTVRSVVFGILLLAIVQGIFAGIGMTIFGVPGSLLWGAVTIIAALVPFVGSSLVLVPAAIYLFITGSTSAAIGLLIWSAVVVGLADNILGPYLIKGTTHMHAFLVLISIFGGIQLFGAVGIIAGPTILAALLSMLELYQSGTIMVPEERKALPKKKKKLKK